MSVALLTTKFHVRPVRRNMVHRLGLVGRLDAGVDGRLTLVSAPAGFGKSTLIAEWVHRLVDRSVEKGDITRVAWLSLEESDNDYVRFLRYFIGALQSMEAAYDPAGSLGKAAAEHLRMPQPSAEQILTPVLNQIAALPGRIVFVLDDYHFIENEEIHEALAFLIEHLPTRMHLVVATREDPPLALARLRAQDEMTELRAADLRFSESEAAQFLNETMGLDLSAHAIATLESRTEGWVAGLQLAGMSLQGREDSELLIESFAGSHRHVTDYLLQEVLGRQSERLQSFLLQTSILERMTGSVCDAVTGQGDGRQMLETLERTNSFIVPLDNERHWYRYHELFADLLRQRLRQSAAASAPTGGKRVADLHLRASKWYEANGLEIEAFRHAAAAGEVDRAERLMSGGGMPLHFRGAASPVLSWLESLPRSILDARPSLWVTYASASVFVGRGSGVEEKLRAAETALRRMEPDDRTKDILGRIAAIRAMLAVPQNRVETIISQSRRALELLHPLNLPVRTVITWALGAAYEFQGDRAAAAEAYAEVISSSRASGNTLFTVAATTSLAKLQESDNRLRLAEGTYRRCLQLADYPLLPFACETYLGLARICYEWNDLDTAQRHGLRCLQLARQIEGVDTPAACWVFLARLKLARGDAAGAAAVLAEAEEFARGHNYVHRMLEIAAIEVVTLLRQGDLAAAAHMAREHDLPVSRARVHLAQGNAPAALAVLEPLHRTVEARGWADERLRILVLQALAYGAAEELADALERLERALEAAEREGFVRIFVDEGPPMARLLLEAVTRGIASEYAQRLLEEFTVADGHEEPEAAGRSPDSVLLEPLSERELEVLRLIGHGLSNQDVGARLFISLHTVKAHTRNIYAKLDAHNRTEAVAKARAFGFLSA